MSDLRRMLGILVFCACCLGGTQSARASAPSCIPDCVNGTCVLDACVCDNGWGGDDCSIPLCNNILATSPGACSDKGTCTAPNTCVCDNGYTGFDCENPICFGIAANQSSVCSSNGTCVAPDTCSCDNGYMNRPGFPGDSIS